MVKSIPDQSLMSAPMTSADSSSATFLPASADGLLPSIGGGIHGTDLFGQDLAPADLSPARVNWNGSLTNGTFGRLGFGSSASESLQSSLENRLRAQLNGSDLCEVIWRRWDTPWGQRRSRPRARVRTTCATDIGLWPTATATANNAQVRGVGAAAKHANRGTTLAGAALWSTASNRDWKDSPGMATERPDGRSRLDQLPRQVFASNGDLAPMASSARLNPEFALWLMGYPKEWISCAPSETP